MKNLGNCWGSEVFDPLYHDSIKGYAYWAKWLCHHRVALITQEDEVLVSLLRDWPPCLLFNQTLGYGGSFSDLFSLLGLGSRKEDRIEEDRGGL